MSELGTWLGLFYFFSCGTNFKTKTGFKKLQRSGNSRWAVQDTNWLQRQFCVLKRLGNFICLSYWSWRNVVFEVIRNPTQIFHMSKFNLFPFIFVSFDRLTYSGYSFFDKNGGQLEWTFREKTNYLRAEKFFQNGPFPASFWSFQQLTIRQYKILPMVGFEPKISGIGSACSANWVTTTAQELNSYSVSPKTSLYIRNLSGTCKTYSE